MSVTKTEVEEVWSMDEYLDALDAIDVWNDLDWKANNPPGKP